MIGLLAIAVASVASCQVEHAHYVLRHDPSVTADFRPVDSGPDWPSHVAIAVQHKELGSGPIDVRGAI